VKSRDTFGKVLDLLFYHSVAGNVGCVVGVRKLAIRMALFRVTASRITETHQVSNEVRFIITYNHLGGIFYNGNEEEIFCV
jgi:hypothetical protein